MSSKAVPENFFSSSSKKTDIFALLGCGLYGLLTLLPDNSSLLVSWPWVFVWQLLLLIPWIFLLKIIWRDRLFLRLGFGLDYGIGLALLGVLLTTVFSPFPQQAIWYGWAVLGAIATLYALRAKFASLKHPTQLLKLQGGLAIGFILLSLFLWLTQTYLPEVNRLQDLQALGLSLKFDFSVLELRNWAPIGHQNYVAGFLVLNLPLLLGLCISAKERTQQGVWGLGFLLGVIALYTTSSRAGWLGFAVTAGLGLISLLQTPRLSGRIRGLSSVGVVVGLAIALVSNNRLRSLLNPGAFDGAGGETAFRLITNLAGWGIGRDHLLFGAGPGSVPLLYQKYRPTWAGQEAEWVYQLHSTPAQIWAEFGLWGVGLTLGLMGWVLYWGVRLWRSPRLNGEHRIMIWGVLSGLAGYGVVALTDYQLDIVSITGALLVYGISLLAYLHMEFPDAAPQPFQLPGAKLIGWSITGIILAYCLWLVPVMRAWQLSSVGFTALQNGNTEQFVRNVERSHQLSPWEPYYLHQLGWNLGNLGLTSSDPQISQGALQDGLKFLEESVKVAPYQEFGYSSLGWLQFVTQQPQAIESLSTAAQLAPGKRLMFHNLGLGLLQQGDADLAIQAFALEIARNPIWLTSPIWRSTQLQPVFKPVEQQVERIYQQLLSETKDLNYSNYLQCCLGSLYWWQGNDTAAKEQWENSGTSLGLELLAITVNDNQQLSRPILKAWSIPQERRSWVEQALLSATKRQPDSAQVDAIVQGLDKSETFEQWLKQNAPISEYRRARAGFGVLSRHIDGPAPVDFSPVVENQAIQVFFSDLFPVPQYSAKLDRGLSSLRQGLWDGIAGRSQSSFNQ